MTNARSIDRHLLAATALAFLMVVTGSCSTTGPPTEVDPTIDELIKVTTGVPSYAGIHVTDAGQADRQEWTVSIFDSSKRKAARRVLREVFGSRATLITLKTRSHEKEVERTIVDEIREGLMGIKGVNSVGYGAPGHLYVGVTQVAAVRKVQTALPDLPVPKEAVVVRANGRYTFL